MKKPVLATSLPPRAIAAPDSEDAQRILVALQSFDANGYDIVSVRRQSEAEPRLDGVSMRSVVGSSEGFFAHKYGPSFADIFHLARSAPVAAVVNSDIFMIPCGAVDYLRTKNRTIVASRRIDVARLGGDFEGVYNLGIDGLFFSPDIDLSPFENEPFASFQLGAPFWDIVIPLVLSFHFDLEFSVPPVLLHAIHPQNWQQEDYRGLRRKAVEITVDYARRVENQSARAAQFLRGLETYCPNFGDAPSKKEIKRAATYMNAFLQSIETGSSADLNPDMNHPYVRACVNYVFSIDSDHVNAARLLARYYASDYGSVKIAHFVVRTFLRVRRIVLKRREVADALLTSADAVALRPPPIRGGLKHDL